MLAGCFVDQGSGRKDFNGNITIEVLVAGAIDISHATGADLFDDTVVAQFKADGKFSPNARLAIGVSSPQGCCVPWWELLF